MSQHRIMYEGTRAELAAKRANLAALRVGIEAVRALDLPELTGLRAAEAELSAASFTLKVPCVVGGHLFPVTVEVDSGDWPSTGLCGLHSLEATAEVLRDTEPGCQSRIDPGHSDMRQRAAEGLAAEFGTDVSEWTV